MYRYFFIPQLNVNSNMNSDENLSKFHLDEQAIFLSDVMRKELKVLLENLITKNQWQPRGPIEGIINSPLLLLYMNVRSLKLISDQIADLYELENWIGITLTETWLYQGILEAEIDTRISHSIDVIETPGCIGVVVIYQRENILCKKVSNFSNSVVGNLIMKYKKTRENFCLNLQTTRY